LNWTGKSFFLSFSTAFTFMFADVWGLMSLPPLFCWGWELQSWEHVFNTPVLLSVLHHTSPQHLTHSLITKERGSRKWCHKDVMESVYRIVLGLSMLVMSFRAAVSMTCYSTLSWFWSTDSPALNVVAAFLLALHIYF